MYKRFSGFFLFGVIFVLTVFVRSSLSQPAYPNRPITVVVPWTAGMTDTVARIVSKAAEKELGQPIIIENKAGASGSIGLNYVLKSKPDGYTLGTPVTSLFIIVPHQRKVPYNPLTDSTDITTLAKYNYGLAVKADAPWNSYEEVVKYAKENPGKFTYSTAGIGITQHICMERMAMKEGIKWTVVPFKSGGEAALACLGGHTDAVVQGSVDENPHIKAGKLKLLLVLDDKRWPASPNVPSILEKGYDFYSWSYIVLVGPRGLREPIRQKLEGAFNKAKRDPSFLDALNKFQVEAGDLSGKAHSELWRPKYDEMGKVIKSLGLVEE